MNKILILVFTKYLGNMQIDNSLDERVGEDKDHERGRGVSRLQMEGWGEWFIDLGYGTRIEEDRFGKVYLFLV